MDILDLSEELKKFQHNGVGLNIEERYATRDPPYIWSNITLT